MSLRPQSEEKAISDFTDKDAGNFYSADLKI